MAQQHKFYAVVLPGLERLAAAELDTLSAHDITIEYGGIHFTGTMQLLHRVNIRSRIITRVLMRLRTFRSMTLEGLRYDLEKIAWHLFLDEKTSLNVEVHTHRSRLNHSDEVAEFALETVERILPKIKSEHANKQNQTLHIRLDNNRGTLSLDTSGERLDRRGYRLESGKAPIRETLASAILDWAKWEPTQTLLVPMCGSGTFAIEAALNASQVAPNIKHDFACLHWPSFKEKEFLKVRDKAAEMKKDTSCSIFASDNHKGAVEITQSNSLRADVEKCINISLLDIHDLEKPNAENGGVLVLNPPYGYRMGEGQKVLSLWHDIGKIVSDMFMNDETWKTIIVCPDQECEKALKLPVKRRLQVSHGGHKTMILECSSNI